MLFMIQIIFYSLLSTYFISMFLFTLFFFLHKIIAIKVITTINNNPDTDKLITNINLLV